MNERKLLTLCERVIEDTQAARWWRCVPDSVKKFNRLTDEAIAVSWEPSDAAGQKTAFICLLWPDGERLEEFLAERSVKRLKRFVEDWRDHLLESLESKKQNSQTATQKSDSETTPPKKNREISDWAREIYGNYKDKKRRGIRTTIESEILEYKETYEGPTQKLSVSSLKKQIAEIRKQERQKKTQKRHR